MIKPTVGRVVWFWPGYNLPPGFILHNHMQPCEARIAYVWSDQMLNICATDQAGNQHPFTSVPLIQDDQPKPSAGFFCSWMPYQVGQAKKLEGQA